MAREIDIVGRMHPGSYNSVEFLVVDETATRGQKVAVHEYPNSDKRFAEPLGKIPPIIDLTAIVHGEFYFSDREILEKELERPGTGQLVHPVYGTIEVQPGDFTISSNQKRIGEFVFKIKFYTSVVVTPTSLPATGITTTSAANDSRLKLDDALEDQYESPFDALGITGAVDSVLGVLDSVNDSIDSVVNPIETFVAETKSAISNFRNGVYNIVQTAAGLKDSLKDMYNSFLQLTLDPETLSDAWNNLSDFGFDEPDRDTSTASRSNRANNQSAIEEHTRIIGLIGIMEAAANTDFDTIDNLQNTVNDIDEKFTEYFENDPKSLALNADLRASVVALRYTMKKALDEKAQNIWRVTTISPGKSSMALTSYRYYGSLDNVEKLIELNENTNVANFSQEIQALTK